MQLWIRQPFVDVLIYSFCPRMARPPCAGCGLRFRSLAKLEPKRSAERAQLKWKHPPQNCKAHSRVWTQLAETAIARQRFAYASVIHAVSADTGPPRVAQHLPALGIAHRCPCEWSRRVPVLLVFYHRRHVRSTVSAVHIFSSNPQLAGFRHQATVARARVKLTRDQHSGGIAARHSVRRASYEPDGRACRAASSNCP